MIRIHSVVQCCIVFLYSVLLYGYSKVFQYVSLKLKFTKNIFIIMTEYISFNNS